MSYICLFAILFCFFFILDQRRWFTDIKLIGIMPSEFEKN